jgi:hypothetical protein
MESRKMHSMDNLKRAYYNWGVLIAIYKLCLFENSSQDNV